MSTVTVSDRALRQLVREAIGGPHLKEPDEPVRVNDVVDQSAAVTDPTNPRFVPQTRAELDVAVGKVVQTLPIDKVPSVYAAVKGAAVAEPEEGDEEAPPGDDMKNKGKNSGDTGVEETVRRAVRKMINGMVTEAPGDLPPVKKIPPGVHGAEYMRRMQKTHADLKRALGRPNLLEPVEDEYDDDEPKRRAYKPTAIGGMADVGGASFEQIAQELGFSVAGAKRAVDQALEKARWVGGVIENDPEELEIIVLTAMNDYIDMLAGTGELSAADVQLMKDHPDIVRELDGFREYLANRIRHIRKDDQQVYDPMGEVRHLQKVAEAMNSVGIKAKVVFKKGK